MAKTTSYNHSADSKPVREGIRSIRRNMRIYKKRNRDKEITEKDSLTALVAKAVYHRNCKPKSRLIAYLGKIINDVPNDYPHIIQYNFLLSRAIRYVSRLEYRKGHLRDRLDQQLQSCCDILEDYYNAYSLDEKIIQAVVKKYYKKYTSKFSRPMTEFLKIATSDLSPDTSPTVRESFLRIRAETYHQKQVIIRYKVCYQGVFSAAEHIAHQCTEILRRLHYYYPSRVLSRRKVQWLRESGKLKQIERALRREQGWAWDKIGHYSDLRVTKERLEKIQAAEQAHALQSLKKDWLNHALQRGSGHDPDQVTWHDYLDDLARNGYLGRRPGQIKKILLLQLRGVERKEIARRIHCTTENIRKLLTKYIPLLTTPPDVPSLLEIRNKLEGSYTAAVSDKEIARHLDCTIEDLAATTNKKKVTREKSEEAPQGEIYWAYSLFDANLRTYGQGDVDLNRDIYSVSKMARSFSGDDLLLRAEEIRKKRGLAEQTPVFEVSHPRHIESIHLYKSRHEKAASIPRGVTNKAKEYVWKIGPVGFLHGMPERAELLIELQKREWEEYPDRQLKYGRPIRLNYKIQAPFQEWIWKKNGPTAKSRRFTGKMLPYIILEPLWAAKWVSSSAGEPNSKKI